MKTQNRYKAFSSPTTSMPTFPLRRGDWDGSLKQEEQ
jgi:hypothetical protein